MSLNRANMLVDTNSPKLARADINDMFADMGYGTSGNVSPITTTGEAGKLFRFSAIANTILHFLRIRRSSTTALDVQNDSSTSVFNVDTTNEVITGTAITTSGEASKLIKTDSAGDLMLSRTKGLYFGNKSTINLGAGIYGIIGAINTQGLSTVPHMIFGTTGNDDKGYISFVNNGAERFNINYDGVIKANSLAGTGNRMVVADSAGNLSATTKLLRGAVTMASGDTVTVTLPEAMPTTNYVVSLSADRGDYNGSVTLTTRDRLLNEFKIHYWAGDGVSAGVYWTLVH